LGACKDYRLDRKLSATRLLALMLFQEALAQTHTLRRNFHQLVIVNELNAVLKREVNWRRNFDGVFFSRDAEVGQLLGTCSVHHQVVVSAVNAHNHAFVHRIVGLHKHSATVVQFAQSVGENFTYALGKLDDRGRMFVKANDPVYEGMIVGIHSRDNDLVVNATRTKQLTNFRVSGKEDAIKITPPIDLTLEYGVEFIDDDELVEITPKSVRLRKRFLKEHERKKAGRA